MNHLNHPLDETIVDLRTAHATSSVVLVCEHASPRIPAEFDNLGLADDALASHVVWDPGALALAEGLADRLQATLIAAKTSRLVYDCNRPPEAPSAMPARSEVFDIPGNHALSEAAKSARQRRVARSAKGCARPHLLRTISRRRLADHCWYGCPDLDHHTQLYPDLSQHIARGGNRYFARQ